VSPTPPPPAGAPLPDDLPLYAPAEPVATMSSGAHGTVVDLHTADAPEVVRAWYATELPRRGWRLERQNDAGTRHLLTASKGSRHASVSIGPDASGTRILLTILPDAS
jgi:hypothetical protein